jgi:quercetin dioxygenase-like cupin family protein
MKSEKVRRVLTGHNQEGKAVFSSDEEFTPVVVPSGDASMATIWASEVLPVNLNDERDGREIDAGTTLNGGSVVRICDMLPNGESPFHRTNSIDYGIVLSGEVELELDDGVTKRCSAGDIIVQRGTIHLWRNPSSSVTCRIVFVLTEAHAYQHDGKALDEIKPH